MLRGRGPAWLALALPRLLVVGVVFTQADAMLMGRWDLVAAEARSLPPAAAAAAFLALGLAVALGERAALASVWAGHAVIRRQPVHGPAFGPGLLALAAPVLAPLAVGGWIWTGTPAGAFTWALAALPGLAGVRSAWGVGAAAVALGQHAPGALWPLALVAGIGVPVAGAAWRATDPPRGGAPRRLPLRLWGPVSALLHRDVLAVWRTAPAVSAGPALGAGLTGFVLWHAGRNLDLSPRGLAGAAAICLLVTASPSGLAWPAAAAGALGSQFDPPRWPVRAVERAAALGLLSLGAMAPAWAAAAVTAPLAPAGHLQVAGYVVSLAGGAVWWVAARPRRPAYGSFPWWGAACLWPAAVGGGAASIAVGAAAFALGVAALQRRRRCG